jgi:archaellum component FlaF (FlaF/FlaG flagellin family)
MRTKVIKQYTTSLDTKKRITIREAVFSHYNVKVYNDGKVVLNPRMLIDPNMISKNSFKMIESSMKNFKEGKVSDPIKLDEFDWDKEEK